MSTTELRDSLTPHEQKAIDRDIAIAKLPCDSLRRIIMAVCNPKQKNQPVLARVDNAVATETTRLDAQPNNEAFKTVATPYPFLP